MNSYTFKLKAITPIFSNGATDKPEIRTSAIKGQLRYWFRAMMGGVFQGDRELVKMLEDSVFGSTDARSSFTMRVNNNTLTIKEAHPNNRFNELHGKTGVLYLGYNLFNNSRGQIMLKEKKNAFWPDENKYFTLEFNFKDEAVKDVLWGAMWMLENLGGIGQRTRRGFGGIRIISSPDNYTYEMNEINIKKIENILNKIAENYCKIAKKIPLKIPLDKDPENTIFKSEDKPEFSCFSKWRLVFCQNDQWKEWIDVLDFAGVKLKLFRQDKTLKNRYGYNTYDYNNIVSAFFDKILPEKESHDFRNDAFGLPIQYFSSSRSKNYKKYRASLEADNINRRASPLFIRPVFISDEKYGLIFLFLNAIFLPSGSNEILKPTGKNWDQPKPIKVDPADLDLINIFLDEIKKNCNGTSIGNIGGKEQ